MSEDLDDELDIFRRPGTLVCLARDGFFSEDSSSGWCLWWCLCLISLLGLFLDLDEGGFVVLGDFWRILPPKRLSWGYG